MKKLSQKLRGEHPLESPDTDLENEAVEAYKTWKYEPMKLDGQPVESRQVQVFNFRYR